MTDKQILAFFTGPSHLPWQRMGNLDRFLGPLPQSFIDNQFLLQKKILQRERAFGMKPILPSAKVDGGKLLKHLKGVVAKAAKRPVRAAAVPSQEAVSVRRNDPLAIGIEELERCLWPPARRRRMLLPHNRQKKI